MTLASALEYNLFAGDFGDTLDRCFKDKIVTFRKGGKCCECLSEIIPKSLGRSTTMCWRQDGVKTYRFCTECTVAMEQCVSSENLDAMEDRFSLGNLRREAMKET